MIFSNRNGIEAFNLKILKANMDLSVVSPEATGVIVWFHKGFLNPCNTIYHHDGVHLNRHENYKFYKSIRAVIVMIFKKQFID